MYRILSNARVVARQNSIKTNGISTLFDNFMFSDLKLFLQKYSSKIFDYMFKIFSSKKSCEFHIQSQSEIVIVRNFLSKALLSGEHS